MDNALDDLVDKLDELNIPRVTGQLRFTGDAWAASADGLAASSLGLLPLVVRVWHGVINEVVPPHMRPSFQRGLVDVDYVIDVILNEIWFTPRLDTPRAPRYTVSLRPENHGPSFR